MKRLLFILMTILPTLQIVMAAEMKTDTIEVSGNCGMCEKRIVAAASIKGVKSVQWDAQTEQLTVRYDAEKTSLDKIEQSIARAGHDTPNHKADEKAYNQLHTCCQYPRK